jgi:CRISPR/Cas system-associated exonuclease Cas4 (RecB family)
VIEKRFARNLPSGLVVSGQPDAIHPARHLILDLKSTKFVPKEPYPSHVWQLNCYRWLVGPMVEVYNLETVYLDMVRIQRLPVPLIEDEEVVAFLDERAQIAQAALEGSPLPDRLSIQDSWMCGSCPFADNCWPDGVPTPYQRKKVSNADK